MFVLLLNLNLFIINTVTIAEIWNTANFVGVRREKLREVSGSAS